MPVLHLKSTMHSTYKFDIPGTQKLQEFRYELA